MGRLSDYFKSFFSVPRDSLPPNELPREIQEDFYQQFGHNFESRERPGHPTYERHQDVDEPVQDDIVIVEGGDMFQEMESMFENFFKGFPFTFHSPPDRFFDSRLGIEAPSDDPGQDQEEPGSLKDKMLKQPDSDHAFDQSVPGIGPHSWFGGLWKSPFQHSPQPDEKLDKDLDSELESGNQSLDDILSQRGITSAESLRPMRPRSSSSSSSSFSQVTTIDSQGRTESRTTKRDSSGRQEVTVTRKLGDQEHIVKHWTNEDGSESSEEKIINIEQDKMSEFDQKWNQSQNGGNDDAQQELPSFSSFYDSILDQLFPRRR